MSGVILHKARWPWPGRCAVCGAWGWLKAWDEGLEGRICTGCFDHAVDAETALASQGLVCRARAGQRGGWASRDGGAWGASGALGRRAGVAALGGGQGGAPKP